MNIFLIRHGQSYGNIIGNKTKTIRGITDNTSLTLKGKKQIEKIAKNFSHQKINLKKIFSSPLKRAYQSALIFKKYYPKTQIIIDENLKEINFGEFERKKWEFIKNYYQDWLNKYLKNKFNTPYPKGESRKDLINRINFFIKKNLTDNDKNYLIITHEEVIRSFLSIFFNNQEYFFSRENLLKIENGKVNSVFFDKKLNHIYQINSDIPSVLNSNLFYLIDNFLNENKIKKFFLNKNQTFSDNLVFTVFYKKNKLKILKIIPKIKEKTLFKDQYLTNILKKQNILTPKFEKIKKIDNYFFCLREFINEKLGSEILKNKKLSEKLAFEVGRFLCFIHKKLSFLKNDNYFKNMTKIYNKEKWKNEFLKFWLKNDLEVLKLINYPNENFLFIKKIFDNYFKSLNDFSEGFIFYDFYDKNFTINIIDDVVKIKNIWDFENSFWGDIRFDIAYTIKLSFFKRKKLINNFLKGYFNNKIKNKDKKIIFFYLLIICTGSINYKNKKGIDYLEEINNLNYFLKNYSKILF